MPAFLLAWRAAGVHAGARLAAAPEPLATPPGCLAAPTCLSITAHPSQAPILDAHVEPDTSTLTAMAAAQILQYFRLADATVRLLPPAPPPLIFQPGDAYVAITPGAARMAGDQPGGAGAAIARFIHLRDYFNAGRLAEALLAHLLELNASANPSGAGVLVVEAR